MRRLISTQDNIKLDIGCGEFKRDGFVGMDKTDFNQEILWDINHGIPLPNDSVSELYSSHFIEHLREHEINNFVIEMMRVCKDKAVVQLICPHASTDEAYYICHYTRWDEQRVRGICMEFGGRISLIGMEVKGINFIIDLIINK